MVAVPVRGAGCIGRTGKSGRQRICCCPREGYGLHPNARLLLTKQDLKVAVPVRGTGCIQHGPHSEVRVTVAVPVRGTGCIINGLSERKN